MEDQCRQKNTKKNQRLEGSIYEDLAADYLTCRGHRLMEKNFRCRMGEIDLITRVSREDLPYWETEDSDILVFVEVKHRSSLVCGSASSAVDLKKQKKIFKVAQYYMMKNQIPPDQLCRFDVIAIDGEEIQHYPNAFGGL